MCPGLMNGEWGCVVGGYDSGIRVWEVLELGATRGSFLATESPEGETLVDA